jgi:hypothetical protein
MSIAWSSVLPLTHSVTSDEDVGDQAGGRIDLDLQLHHVAAGRRADHAGAYAVVALVEGADVARVLVVFDDLGAVSHVFLLGCGISVLPTGWC